MEELKENLNTYYITIKPLQQNYHHYSYNDPRRQKAQEDAKNHFDNAFIKVINEVVASGGVICMAKQQLDSEWQIYANGFIVKLTEAGFNKIKDMSDVQSCNPHIQS